MSPERLDALIRSIPREPRQRTARYGEPSHERIAAGYDAPALHAMA
jgi:hypothetical protein